MTDIRSADTGEHRPFMARLASGPLAAVAAPESESEPLKAIDSVDGPAPEPGQVGLAVHGLTCAEPGQASESAERSAEPGQASERKAVGAAIAAVAESETAEDDWLTTSPDDLWRWREDLALFAPSNRQELRSWLRLRLAVTLGERPAQVSEQAVARCATRVLELATIPAPDTDLLPGVVPSTVRAGRVNVGKNVTVSLRGGPIPGAPVANGMLRLTEEGEFNFLPADRRQFVTARGPIRWPEREVGKPKRGEKFVIDLAGEKMAETVWAALGQVFLNDRRAPWLIYAYGPGGTGKGTLVDLAIEIVGKSLTASWLDLASAGGNRFMLSQLAGKKLLTAPELPPDKSPKASRALAWLLALAAGDRVWAERKIKQVRHLYRPQLGIVVASNHAPAWTTGIADMAAVKRRLIVVRANKKVSKPVAGYAQALARAEGPQILRRAALAWQALVKKTGKGRSPAIPDAAVEARDAALRSTLSLPQLFVAECCELGHEDDRLAGPALTDVIDAYWKLARYGQGTDLPMTTFRSRVRDEVRALVGGNATQWRERGQQVRGYVKLRLTEEGLKLSR